MLTSAMLQLYNDTLPGEYLELSHTALPTPPSSADSTGDQFLPATPPAARPTRRRFQTRWGRGGGP